MELSRFRAGKNYSRRRILSCQDMEQVGIIARRECGGCQGMERVKIVRRRRWNCQETGGR
jgi:hypothetical protein